MPFLSGCPHRIYFPGNRIAPGDDGYPGMVWGSYLPGDEPGWVCTKTDSHCDPDEGPALTTCPYLRDGHYVSEEAA